MGDQPLLLQLGPVPQALASRLLAEYRLVQVLQADAPEALDPQILAECVGLVTTARTGVSAAWLQNLPALRVISSYGAGLDRLDLAAAQARGIAVGYTPGALTPCVADLAIGLLIDVARRISAADRFVRAGRWKDSAWAPGLRVSGKRLGILGLGEIGRAIARRAEGFAMEVAYTNRRPAEGVPYRFEPVLTELARWADFLVVSASAQPGDQALVNTAVLEALGPTGILVNVGRGTLVDEAALLRALQQAQIAGAGLDVHPREPEVAQKLLALDQVVVLPHMGGATREAALDAAQQVLDNLRQFFSTGHLVSDALAGNSLGGDGRKA